VAVQPWRAGECPLAYILREAKVPDYVGRTLRIDVVKEARYVKQEEGSRLWMGGRLSIPAGRTKLMMKSIPNLSRQSSAAYRKIRRSAWFYWMIVYWYSHLMQQF
jgi:hypothetical protein